VTCTDSSDEACVALLMLKTVDKQLCDRLMFTLKLVLGFSASNQIKFLKILHGKYVEKILVGSGSRALYTSSKRGIQLAVILGCTNVLDSYNITCVSTMLYVIFVHEILE
jgi:hypothetical protein